MNIVLINPRDNQKDIAFSPAEISDHIGLGYIASALKKNGHICSVIDADLFDLSVSRIVEICIELRPDLLGVTLLHDTFPQAVKTIKEIKNNIKVQIFVGGHLATIAPKTIFEVCEDVDYILVGEVESVINSFIDCLYNKKCKEHVPNLICRKNLDKISLKKQLKPPRLSQVSWPVRYGTKKIFELQKYYGLPKALRVSSSRGCHGSCNFCSINSFYSSINLKKIWRARPIRDVIEEIKYLYNKYNVNIFYFSDDNFIGPKEIALKRINMFCKYLRRYGLKIRFTISTRIDGIDYGICKLLKEVGLVHIGVGLENICNNALYSLNKEYNNEILIKYISIIRKLELSTSFFMILYHPLASIEEIYQNYMLLNKIGYFDRQIKKRNAYDVLVMSRLLVRRFTPYENMLLDNNLHQGYYKDNPMIAKYKFADGRVEEMWDILYKTVRGDEVNAKAHFLRIISRYITL